MSQSKKFGFTLIELLVVISIIALLLGILVPVLGVAKKNANQMKESVNLRNIGVALAVFGTSNKDWYPGLTSSAYQSGWNLGSNAAVNFTGKYYAANSNAVTNSTTPFDGLGNNVSYAEAVVLEDASTNPAQWFSPGENATSGGATAIST